MYRVVGLMLLLMCAAAAAAETPGSGQRARAVRRAGAITVDGDLGEAAWDAAPKQSGFTQRFPKDGVKAELDTRFAVLYDDAAVYIGVWADDPEPHNIRRLLTRRDVDAPADAILIGIDSYHDRRTAYVFQLNAAGVQRDMLLFDDTDEDESWDAVWMGDAKVTASGWSAEFRIPLNQLRFVGSDMQEWGLQVMRVVSRTQEQATWSPWPRTTSAVVSRFGTVAGIDHVKPGRRLELLPYATGGFQVMPVEAGDPLNDSMSGTGNVGLDLKYGLGPAFTVSATLNPDFGQVEADPSQVNLSGNELFLAEKRPFFLEGVDLFKLPIGNSDGSVEGAFYSRRIGATQIDVSGDYEYSDAPTATTIYGAVKLTGKTRGGWSVGVLDAVTGEESAAVSDGDGEMARPVVAPLTNYAVARVKRDLRDGKSSIGASASAVHRALGDTGLADQLHDQAYTVGAQLQHRWADNAWKANLNMVGSLVHGTPEAIAGTQRAQRHLFQRPDASHLELDPTRTSLTGGGARWQFGRMGDTKHWRVMTGGDLRTPGLELNDLGFQRSSDEVVPYVFAQYHDETPGDDVLNWQANADVYAVASLEPKLTVVGLECNANVQLVNYWSLGGGCNIQDARWSRDALRGGAALRIDPRAFGWVWLSTDNRKRVFVTVDARSGRDWTADSIDNGFDVGVTVRARSNIELFAGPSWTYINNAMQYVEEAVDDNGQSHFVFARITQTIAAMTLRLNWTFSPRMTLQAYAQPFIASGRYSELKDVDQPGALRFRDRFHRFAGSELALVDGTYHAQHNGNFSFDRPDFDFGQLRSTVVFRWEYRPGSSLFAIWSHGRTSESDNGVLSFGRDLRSLRDADSENIVMVKANYWIGL